MLLSSPVTEEVGPHLQTSAIGPRLTPHVRNRQKYVDVPVPASRVFEFRGDGRTTTACAHTLREFVEGLDAREVAPADGYLRRGDFSRWIADILVTMHSRVS